MDMKPNIELHIEELVLHGFKSGDRHAITEAVQQELARLFAEQGLPTSLAQSTEIAHITGNQFNVKANAKPRSIGTQVAESVYKGMNIYE